VITIIERDNVLLPFNVSAGPSIDTMVIIITSKTFSNNINISQEAFTISEASRINSGRFFVTATNEAGGTAFVVQIEVYCKSFYNYKHTFFTPKVVNKVICMGVEQNFVQ